MSTEDGMTSVSVAYAMTTVRGWAWVEAVVILLQTLHFREQMGRSLGGDVILDRRAEQPWKY